jgi:hypothetical protein
MPADNPTLARLEEQIRWYDERSARSQRVYKWLKFVTIFSAAAIPILVVFDVPTYVAALLAGVIAVSEGVQQVNQYQQNWIMYRSTAEALKHEKYLYLAGAAHYAAAENPLALLAERLEGLVSQEHAKWVSARQEALKTTR